MVLGIVLARQFEPDPGIPYVLAALAAATGVFLGKRRIGRVSVGSYLLLFSLTCTGAVRYSLLTGSQPPHHISNFADRERPVSIVGLITKYPERRGQRTHLYVEVDSLLDGDKKLMSDGGVLVRLADGLSQPRYGDRIQVTGLLRTPRGRRNPGEFDYQEYLLAQRVFAIIFVRKPEQISLIAAGGGNWFVRELVVPTKQYLEGLISSHLPAVESALLHGLLIGERGGLSFEVKDAFAKLGVIHVLAVSGLHVGFIILIFMGVLGMLRIPYAGRVILTLLCLLFYAFLTNLKPPVVRASTMGGIVLLGSLLERRGNFYNSLAIAALVILIANPLELFQPGFQLSFAAVTAIVYLYPRLQSAGPVPDLYEACVRIPPLRYLMDLLLVSTAAFLGTLPLTVLYFERLPIFSLIANLVVVPFTFLSLSFALAAALLNIIWSFLGDIYMAAAGLSLATTISFVEWAETLPHTSFEVYSLSGLQLLGYAIGLLLLFNVRQPRARFLLITAGLTVLNVGVWRYDAGSNNHLQAAFLDVGQGDAVVLTLPDGRHMLIDGGARNPYFDTGRRIIAPYLKRQGISELAAVVLTHADSDHLGGLPYILRHFEVKEVWDNGQAKETRIYREYLHLIDSLQVEHRILKAGTYLDSFHPVQIFVVHPSERFLQDEHRSANDGSLSLKVSLGSIDFMLAGDVEKSGESSLSRFGDLLRSEVLKVNHHGSRTSSTDLFLTSVAPELAVISVGQFNHFGHPAPEVLERFTENGIKALRTDRQGAIILVTDGSTVQQRNWR